MTADFEFVKEIVDNTDWEETRKHLATLQKMVVYPAAEHLNDNQIEAIRFAIEDISHMQFLVVELGYLSEEEVFGPEEDEETDDPDKK
jgi:hypothetical protein